MHLGLVRALALPIVLGISLPATASGFDHQDFDEYLRKVATVDGVDYRKAGRLYPVLKGYLRRVADFDPQKLDSDEARLAFYTNAYNAYVIYAVLENRRPRDVREVRGFFNKNQHKVAGELLTLNDIEQQKLRAVGDPRVHFVLSRASRSSPPLWSRAYTPENWAGALEGRTKEFLNRRGEIVVDNQKKLITASKLFEWYEPDWGSMRAAREFIASYVPNEAVPLRDETYAMKARDYDWSLNEKVP